MGNSKKERGTEKRVRKKTNRDTTWKIKGGKKVNKLRERDGKGK